jgi:hypothetical protein
VILGCAQPEGEQGWNIARFAALRAQLPVEFPASPSTASAPPALRPSSRRSAHPRRRRPRRRGRRRRIHEPAALWRPQAQPQSLARRALPRRRCSPWASPPSASPAATTSPAKIRTPSPSPATKRPWPRRPPAAFRRTDSGDGHHCCSQGAKAGKPKVTETTFRRRRRPARRHLARSPRQTQARLPRAGNRHRRQLLADLRRRGRRRSHGSPAPANWAFAPSAAWWPTPSPAACRRRWAWSHLAAIPKALKPRRPHPQRHRPHRTQRGLCRAGPGRHPRTGPRPRAHQRQRRRHRPRPSARLHRRQAHRHAAPTRCAAARLRYGMVTMCVGGGMGAAAIFEPPLCEIGLSRPNSERRGSVWASRIYAKSFASGSQ